MSAVITFDDFEPGKVLAEGSETFGPELSDRWRRIFGNRPADGAGGGAEGASIALVMMMRAYLRHVVPRPPGNVHARQRFTLEGTPRPGEDVRSVVTCVHKEMKRGRRYVELEASGTGQAGRPIYVGRLTLIWAA